MASTKQRIKIFRQRDDALAKALSEIRTYTGKGNLSVATSQLLAGCVAREMNTAKPVPKLFPLRVEVAAENGACLAKLVGELHQFEAKDDSAVNVKTKDTIYQDHQMDQMVALLSKNTTAERLLELKAGARAILTQNNAYHGLVNGSMGTVVEFTHVNDERCRRTGSIGIIRSPTRIKAELLHLYPPHCYVGQPPPLPNGRWPVVKFDGDEMPILCPAVEFTSTVQGQY